MRRVLITASVFSHIRNFHLPYLESFHNLGWEVHVACGGKCCEIPNADQCVSLPLQKRFLSGQNIRSCFTLRHLMQQNHYDLVIAHTSLASFFTRLAEKGLSDRPPTINVMHGYLFGPNTGKIKSAFLKGAEYLVSPETDLILTMNEWDREWTQKHLPKVSQAFIPGMGVSDRCMKEGGNTFSELQEEDYILVYAAEFSPRKNQKLLIQALSALPLNVKLLLPGEGALLEECKQMAKELGVEKRVLFPGQMDTIGDALAVADVAVSSSRSEGLPFNLLEAMRWSLPIVASNVKGNCDLVQDGVNGYLFRDNDEVAFLDAIQRLRSNKEKAEKMGERSRKLSEQYYIETVKPQVMKAYLSLIKG